MLLDDIKSAVAATNPAQRNWDRSKTLPREHIDLFEEIIRLAPTKQNETHYKVYMIENQDVVRMIYNETNHFAVHDGTDLTDSNGVTQYEYNVKNSQVLANLLIAICDDWDQSKSRTLIHRIVDERGEESIKPNVWKEKSRIIHMGQGILLGQLMMAATTLGYRTGMCSAFDESKVAPYIENSQCNCLLGIGYPHPDKDRKEHEEVYNKDIADRDYRTGPDNEKWKFPSFKKEVYVKRL